MIRTYTAPFSPNSGGIDSAPGTWTYNLSLAKDGSSFWKVEHVKLSFIRLGVPDLPGIILHRDQLVEAYGSNYIHLLEENLCNELQQNYDFGYFPQ